MTGHDEAMVRAVNAAAHTIRPAKALLERFVVEALGVPEASVRVEDFDAALLDVAQTPGYHVMAGRRFDDDRPGVALFHRGSPRAWSVYELCSGLWRPAWDRQLERGRTVPATLPRAFTTTSVARATVQAFPDYELRCIRVEHEPGEPARFRAGRPLSG
jgi:hypothetical protein